MWRIIKQFYSKQSKQSIIITKMAQKIQAMNTSLGKTSPRFLSCLFILSTLPTIYFGYQVLTTQYKNQKYVQNTDNSLKYFYTKNIIFFICGLTLCHLDYLNPSGKFLLQKKSIKRRYIPLVVSIIGLLIPITDKQYIAFPALFTDIYTMTVQAKLTNQGVLPFWYYSFRHYIRFFDIFIFIMVFFALRRLHKRRQSHPHQFTQETQIINQQISLK